MTEQYDFIRYGGIMLHKKISLLSLLALLAAVGCETVEGAGRDIERAGETIRDTAQEAEG